MSPEQTLPDWPLRSQEIRVASIPNDGSHAIASLESSLELVKTELRHKSIQSGPHRFVALITREAAD
jgi:hypothetical protein